MDWYLFTVNNTDGEFTGELWKTNGPETQFEGDYQLQHRDWAGQSWQECVDYFMKIDGHKILSNGHMLIISGKQPDLRL